MLRGSRPSSAFPPTPHDFRHAPVVAGVRQVQQSGRQAGRRALQLRQPRQRAGQQRAPDALARRARLAQRPRQLITVDACMHVIQGLALGLLLPRSPAARGSLSALTSSSYVDACMQGTCRLGGLGLLLPRPPAARGSPSP